MSEIGDVNPYDDPKLREAFRWGWKARLRGDRRYTDELYEASEKAQAWLDGYDAAESRLVKT